MTRLARFTKELFDLDTFYIFTDFTEDQADVSWVDTVTDSGTVVYGDARRGIATLTPSDGTVADNDEAYLASPNEVFLWVSGKPLYAKASIQFTEGNTDDVNIAFGFQNAVGANSIVDDGAGVKVSGSCACIYKVDGGTVWKCVTATNGTSVVSTSTTTAGGAAFQTLEIEILDFDSTNMQAVFFCDGEKLKDSNNNVIRHMIPIASATEMQLFVGIKNGAATTVEALLVDYVYAHQLR
jgi:hypothetical protein